MTASTSPRRSSAASAIILVAVILLFGAAAFVAGLAVAGPNGVGGAPSGTAEPSVGVPSDVATPEATPGPTPVLETLTCTAPSEAFAVLCEIVRRHQG